MSDTTVNQVRNVLMNELGLFRNYIAQLAQELVAKEVAKEVSKAMSNGVIDRLIHSQLDSLLPPKEWGRNSLADMVQSSAKEQAVGWVKAHVTISPTVAVEATQDLPTPVGTISKKANRYIVIPDLTDPTRGCIFDRHHLVFVPGKDGDTLPQPCPLDVANAKANALNMEVTQGLLGLEFLPMCDAPLGVPVLVLNDGVPMVGIKNSWPAGWAPIPAPVSSCTVKGEQDNA